MLVWKKYSDVLRKYSWVQGIFYCTRVQVQVQKNSTSTEYTWVHENMYSSTWVHEYWVHWPQPWLVPIQWDSKWRSSQIRIFSPNFELVPFTSLVQLTPFGLVIFTCFLRILPLFSLRQISWLVGQGNTRKPYTSLLW